MRTLNEIRVSETVRATKLHVKGPLRRRIMDMGITKGVLIQVKRIAPLGDPIEVLVRGYSLSLRKSDCAFIEVEFCDM